MDHEVITSQNWWELRPALNDEEHNKICPSTHISYEAQIKTTAEETKNVKEEKEEKLRRFWQRWRDHDHQKWHAFRCDFFPTDETEITCDRNDMSLVIKCCPTTFHARGKKTTILLEIRVGSFVYLLGDWMMSPISIHVTLTTQSIQITIFARELDDEKLTFRKKTCRIDEGFTFQRWTHTDLRFCLQIGSEWRQSIILLISSALIWRIDLRKYDDITSCKRLSERIWYSQANNSNDDPSLNVSSICSTILTDEDVARNHL